MPSPNEPFDETKIPLVTSEEATRRRNKWMDGLIIDSAREPLVVFEKKQTEPAARRSFLWYHVLRPCVLVAFWLFVLWYVWTHFLDIGGTMVKNDMLLVLYAGIIGVIFLVMLVLAPLRLIYQKRAMGRTPQAATTAEMADFATQQEKTLLAWQTAQTANAYHNNAGDLQRVDVLVDRDNPHQARLAKLLGLVKTRGSGPAASSEDGKTDAIVNKPNDAS